MLRKLIYILAGILIGPTLVGVAYAATPALTVTQGGTGWGAFGLGNIPIGGGTSLPGSLRFATSTGFRFATSTQTLTATYASTTAVSATSVCLTGDICRTTWPTGGSGTFSWTPTSWGNSTSTILGFPGFISTASSTIVNTNFLANGNVGINIQVPTVALDVSGIVQTTTGFTTTGDFNVKSNGGSVVNSVEDTGWVWTVGNALGSSD